MSIPIAASTTLIDENGGVVTARPAQFLSFQLKTDGVNNPTVGFYDGINTAGDLKIPDTEYVASNKGLYGYSGGSVGKQCPAGIYANISCGGTCEVTADFVETHLV